MPASIRSRSTTPNNSAQKDPLGVESLAAWERFKKSWPEPLRTQLEVHETIAKQCYCWGFRDSAHRPGNFTEGEISACLGVEALAALMSRRAAIDAELASRQAASTEAGSDDIMRQHLHEGGSPCS